MLTNAQSAGAVIDRMRQAGNVESDAELARWLHVSRSTIFSWRKRNSVPYEQCVEISANLGISLNWLLLGQGPKEIWKSPEGRFDPTLLKRVIRSFELRIRKLNAEVPEQQQNIKGESWKCAWLESNDKAQSICSIYLWWTENLQEIEATGKFTREEAYQLLQKVVTEPNSLEFDRPEGLEE